MGEARARAGPDPNGFTRRPMPKGTKSKGANRKKSSSPLPAWVAYVAVLAVALALVLLVTERPETTEGRKWRVSDAYVTRKGRVSGA